MATWQEFSGTAPDLAAAVRARFEAAKHHVLATLRRDGAPRVSGTEVGFTEDGRLAFGAMPGAVKTADLRRDPRCALHANPGDGSMEGGDSKISGVATVTARDDSDLIEIGLREVVHTTVENDRLRIRLWKAGDSEVREIWRQ